MSTVKRAYRYRFYPTDEQKQILDRTFGCVRYAYNWALRLSIDTYQQKGKGLSYKQLSAHLTALKQQAETRFLNEVSCVPCQQGLRHLARAYVNFFEGRAGYPTFKKRRDGQSAEYTKSAFTFQDGQLTLAKMDAPLDIHWSRPLPDGASPSTVIVSRNTAGRYFARDHKKLARAQRKLSRKRNASKNRERQRRRVAKIHARIADQRRAYQNQLSTQLVRENQTIVVESLAVKHMMQHPTLAKSIADVGWGEFVRQLEYKAEWYGRSLVKIDRWYPSSKTCSACRHVLDSLSLDCREWSCPVCGAHHDRDFNAAKSILTEGLRMSADERAAAACGGSVSANLYGTREASSQRSRNHGR